MSGQVLKHKVLRLLAENAWNNSSPQVMDSNTIASMLGVSLPEIKRMLIALHASGVITSNMEGQYSLITQEGMQWLSEMSVIGASGYQMQQDAAVNQIRE